jgi:hypothetical protein
MTEQDQERKKVVAEFFHLVNSYGSDRELSAAIVEHLKNEHRTLQQTFWRIIQKVAVQYKDFNTDLRNEAAVKFAKDIADIDGPMPFI